MYVYLMIPLMVEPAHLSEELDTALISGYSKENDSGFNTWGRSTALRSQGDSRAPLLALPVTAPRVRTRSYQCTPGAASHQGRLKNVTPGETD